MVEGRCVDRPPETSRVRRRRHAAAGVVDLGDRREGPFEEGTIRLRVADLVGTRMSVSHGRWVCTRPYAHLRAEFEHRHQQLQHVGQTPDPKAAQIERPKAYIGKLNGRPAQANSTIAQLSHFRTQSLGVARRPTRRDPPTARRRYPESEHHLSPSRRSSGGVDTEMLSD